MERLNRKYARLMLDLFIESQTVEKALDESRFLLGSLQSEEITHFLKSDRQSKDEKKSILEKILGNEVNNLWVELFQHLIDQNQVQHILPMLTHFKKEALKHLNRREAELTSAIPLSDEKVQQVLQILEEKIGSKIDLKTTVNPDLIGGFSVLMDDYIFDATVRSRLNELEKNIKGKGDVHVNS